MHLFLLTLYSNVCIGYLGHHLTGAMISYAHFLSPKEAQRTVHAILSPQSPHQKLCYDQKRTVSACADGGTGGDNLEAQVQ